MAVVIIALWIGSAIAGWFLFWPWLFVPVVLIGLHIARTMERMRAARERNGLPTRGGISGASMAGANARLLILTALQHAAIFGVAAGAHRLVG